VPWGLKRYQESRQAHFVTFSCYHRLPFLLSTHARQTFESALERVRHKFDLYVYGYVVMPEHIHLLLSEPRRGTLAEALKSLKQSVSRLIGGREHFWQKRYYDFNIRNHRQFVEKLRYLHRKWPRFAPRCWALTWVIHHCVQARILSPCRMGLSVSSNPRSLTL
jgi:REP-associated tyrosine transposase